MTTDRATGLTAGTGPRFLRAFLDRFRRHGGVPAAVTDDIGAELGPLFAALDDLEQEAAGAESVAAGRAATRAHDVAEEIQQILSDARGHAEAERADAIKAGRRTAEAEAARIIRVAEIEAERIRREGRRRLPALVAEVLECVGDGPG